MRGWVQCKQTHLSELKSYVGGTRIKEWAQKVIAGKDVYFYTILTIDKTYTQKLVIMLTGCP